jgi:hypothetical protein
MVAVEDHRYTVDIRVFVVVIVTSMALAFGVGVGMGPQPGQFAATTLPSVHSVEMAPSSSIPTNTDDLHEPAGQVRNNTIRVCFIGAS